MGRPKKTDRPGIGHNSIDRNQLSSLVDRIESLEAEKATISEDIKSIYADAKDAGFDVKALREVVRLRRQDPDERKQKKSLVEEYLRALGDLADLPLGKAAIERAGLTPPV